MKKPTLRDISDKLDIIEGKLDEVLRRIAPRPLPEKTQIIARKEPEYKPSPHRASLAARSNECVPLADRAPRSYPPHGPLVDKNMGTL